ncbi:MAG: hypothetical protein IPG67_05975, partial [Acidobacteria bacterium]|nr:hypothetical protein [Acidobacteriota bacterium]
VQRYSFRNAGYYRVSGSDLFANGLEPGSDPRFLRIFIDGIEQPITVGGEDRAVRSTEFDRILRRRCQHAETADRVYYVVASGEIGKRTQFADLEGGPSNAAAFMSTIGERKDRSIYISNLLNGEENFFGDRNLSRRRSNDRSTGCR